jgi:hypothetical protein
MLCWIATCTGSFSYPQLLEVERCANWSSSAIRPTLKGEFASRTLAMPADCNPKGMFSVAGSCH